MRALITRRFPSNEWDQYLSEARRQKLLNEQQTLREEHLYVCGKRDINAKVIPPQVIASSSLKT